MTQENATLKGRLSVVETELDSAESQQKMQRETISRLMTDQQNVAQFNLEMDNLRLVCISCFTLHRLTAWQDTSVYFRLLSVQCHAWQWTDMKSFECMSVCLSEVHIVHDSDRSLCPIFVIFEM